jgi:uncharacterized surface protein with fasciclin (FAS1) repeats
MAKVIRLVMLGLAAAGLITGCKQDKAGPNALASDAATAAPMAAKLSESLGNATQFSTLAVAIKETGLDGVLSGKASYTLFAPTNAAFDALGERGQELRQPEQRAALAALLREHIVPGVLTVDDLDKALARSGGRPLKLRSMGKGTLTLSREGETIVVTAGDGAKARLTADSTSAKNGAALGIDGVLKKLG